MANLDYGRRKKFQIIAIAMLLLISVFMLSACSADSGVYDVSGDTIKQPTHFMAKLMLLLNEEVVNFGWTVVAFTVILRLCLLPLDFWQKLVGRKNAKAMKRMKPQLEVLQEKHKNDKERYQQAQMALYKKEKFSMLGSCLPTIATMIVFFIVFSGFREMVGYQFALDYKTSYNTFNNELQIELIKYGYTDINGDGKVNKLDVPKEEVGSGEKVAAAIEKAQIAVKDVYYSADETDRREFLWIKNIFVPDTWKSSVPDYLVISGQSGFATSKLSGVTSDEYNEVMAKTLGTGGWGDEGKWNGFILLPILSILLSFLSTKLLSASNPTPPTFGATQAKNPDGTPKKVKENQMQGTMKVMTYMMPVMMGVFSLMYSAAFALYMLVSSLAAVVFQLSFNLIAKIIDKSREDKSDVIISKR